MKLYAIIAALALTWLCAASSEKEVHINFDPSKLTTETKGSAILFRYRDQHCRYIEHGIGAPVLPCVQVYVLMPRDAVYKGCTVRAESHPLCGTYNLYCRKRVEETARSARRYPPKLVEFLGKKELNGCHVFMFRAYPISCQLGDSSVTKILRMSLTIEHDVPAGAGMYAPVSARRAAWLKRLVINPNDLDRWTLKEQRVVAKRTGPISNRRESLTREVFATEIRDRGAARRSDSLIMLDGRPDVSLPTRRNAIEEFVGDDVFITEENDIMYAPILF